MVVLPPQQPVEEVRQIEVEETIPQLIKRVALYRGVLDQVETIENLVWSESRNNPLADNGYDRGLVQINRKYNPDVTDKQAFDPEFSINFFIDKLLKGEEWKWTAANCYSYAKLFVEKLPKMAEIVPNSHYPTVGGLVIFNYHGGLKHISVVTKVTKEGIWVKEANYEPALISTRLVSWNDESLMGFAYYE